MRTFFSRWFMNAPWWVLSAGLHAVLLLGATLVYIERLLAIDGDDFQVVPRSTRNAEIIDYPRDVVERRSFLPPEDEITKEDPLLAYDLKEVTIPSEEPGGDTPMRPFEVTSSAIWGPNPVLNPRRKPTDFATNILKVGIGNGYGQRFENGSFRRSFDRSIGCCSRLTEGAANAALKWLARHQSPDGRWSAGGFGDSCGCAGKGDSDYDIGVTGLALLAYYGAGYTHLSRYQLTDVVAPDRILKYGDVTKNAVQWLVAQQDAEGGVGPRGPKHLYNHAIASLALSEAYGMTMTDALRLPAQKAIDFLVAAQNPGKGWRYSSRSGDNDTSVTGWAVMALKSAEMSGLSFPPSAYQGALHWLDEATDRSNHFKTGYTQAGTGKVYVPGKNEQFDDHPTMSAVSALSRLFIRKNRQDPELGALTDLSMDLPQWETNKVDFYYWYYGSLALYQYDGPRGGLWTRWEQPLRQAIVPSQKIRKDGCANGSWDASEDRWGAEGGRVYATAINALTLEVYYRYPNVFGAGK